MASTPAGQHNGHQSTRGSVAEMSERYTAEAKEKVAEVAEQARETSGELWDNALELIEKNPAASVGIAFLAGLAVAAVFSGGSEKKSETKESLTNSLNELRGYLDQAVAKLQD